MSFSESGAAGMIGVILAGVMVAGAGGRLPMLAGPGGGKVVMVTLWFGLVCPSPGLSYIRVDWLKFGMVIAGATTALVTVKFTGLACCPLALSLLLAGTNVTYPEVTLKAP